MMKIFKRNMSNIIDEFNSAVELLETNPVKGFNAMLKVAKEGYAFAQNNVGACYSNGIGVEQNDTKAFYWYDKASKQGDDMATLNIAQFYIIGIGTKKDMNHAMKLCLDLLAKNSEYSEAASALLDKIMGNMDEDNNVSINPYIDSAIQKIRQEDFKGGIKDLDKAISINPNLWGLYYNRGLAKSNLDDYIGAKEDFDKAIQLNPNSSEAYFARGTMKFNLNDSDAMEDIEISKKLKIHEN